MLYKTGGWIRGPHTYVVSALSFVLLAGLLVCARSASAALSVSRTANLPSSAPLQGTPTPTPTLTRTATPTTCGLMWRLVSSPNPGSSSNSLSGIAVVSANDVWAVGTYNNGGSDQALTMHWDGTRWSVIPNPSAGSLVKVAAVSSD